MAPDKHLRKKRIVADARPAPRWLQQVEFRLSAESIAAMPAESRAEIAFAGRSNAGKSSALNALTRRRALARVSKTPGRTRQINFFSLERAVYLVDLPGYGYARVSGETRHLWSSLVSEYLRSRTQLVGLVVVMDARHPLTDLDLQLLEWFRPSGRPVHLLLTKADKLSRSQGALQLNSVRRAVASRHVNCSVQLFSSVNHSGVAEAEVAIARWLAPYIEDAAIE